MTARPTAVEGAKAAAKPAAATSETRARRDRPT
jgi:hypothetical protein